jgi:DNA-binding PadR family transcriptional regulator
MQDFINKLNSFLVLKIISSNNLIWGYEIKKQVEEIMKLEFITYQFKLSSLYTLLRKYDEKKGFIETVSCPDDISPGRDKRCYKITKKGLEELEILTQNWKSAFNIYNKSLDNKR